MFDRFAGEFHSRLGREDKGVAQRFRPGQTFARFFGSVFGGDGLPRAKSNDANVPFALFFGDKLGEGTDGVFADDVRGGAVVFRPASAPEVDDVAGVLLLHERHDVFGAEESAAEVRLDDTVPKLFTYVSHRWPARDAPIKMGHDAGVVDQRVDLAEAIDDFMDHAAHVLFIAHVRRDGEGLRFESLKLAKGLAHPLHVRVGKYDSSSRFYQSMRRVAPDALGGAGNNDNSALIMFWFSSRTNVEFAVHSCSFLVFG